MELVDLFLSFILLFFGLLCLCIPYTLSGMNDYGYDYDYDGDDDFIYTCKNAKNAAIRGHVLLHEDVWSNVSPIL